MENQNQPTIKKNFKTMKEAFAALPEATRQHSIRVAEYTRSLFIEAIAIEMRMGDPKATALLDPDFERGAYLCGLYHDIGKVLVPQEYHVAAADFDAQETALYRKHTTDGVTLARQTVYGEELSDTEQKMILEAIEFHHQRPTNHRPAAQNAQQSPSGTDSEAIAAQSSQLPLALQGFPEDADEHDICLPALLTGFADYLDHLVSERRSETPFEDVMGQIQSSFTEESEMQLLVQEAYSRLRRTFLKYQEQSAKIPTPLPFVKRKNNRSFELKYRPIVDRRHKNTVGLQARIYFKDNKETFVEYEEVKTILNKNKLIPEVGRYFLYEAGDMTKRIDACELPIQYVALELMPVYFTQPKIVAAMQQQLEDARMQPGKLILSLEESMFLNPSKALMANLERITAAAIPMLLTGWTGEYLKAEELVKYSFTKVALHNSLYPGLDSAEVKSAVKTLQQAGIEVIAGELDKAKYNGMLNALDIATMTGPMAGDYTTEDELILEELRSR